MFIKTTVLVLAGAFLIAQLSGCTPLLVGGAAAGGGYAGYKAKEEGYSINITKEAKGTKANKNTNNKEDNSTINE